MKVEDVSVSVYDSGGPKLKANINFSLPQKLVKFDPKSMDATEIKFQVRQALEKLFAEWDIVKEEPIHIDAL